MRKSDERITHGVQLNPEDISDVFTDEGALIEPPTKGVAYNVHLEFEEPSDFLRVARKIDAVALELRAEYERVTQSDHA